MWMGIDPLLECADAIEGLIADDGAAAGIVQAAALFGSELVLVGVVEEVVQAGEELGVVDELPLGGIKPDAGAGRTAIKGEGKVQRDSEAGKDARAMRADTGFAGRLGRRGCGEGRDDFRRANGSGRGAFEPGEVVVEGEKAAAATGADVGERIGGRVRGDQRLVGADRAVHGGRI